MALLGCAGEKPPSCSSGTVVDANAWLDLPTLGGENEQQPAGGRQRPASPNGSSGSGMNGPATQRERQDHEERQARLEMEELARSTPNMPPFRDARSWSSSGVMSLLAMGGRHVQDLPLYGRQRPGSTNGDSSASVNGAAAKRERQEHEER